MSSANKTDSTDDIPEEEATVTAKARKFSHEAIDAAAEKAEDLERKIRAESGRLGNKADTTRHDVSEQIDETLHDVQAYIRKEPVKAAGIAFAAGILATLILRR